MWKKKNEIVWWSKVEGLPEIQAVDFSNHFLPDWFKKMPGFVPNSEGGEMQTAKRCPAILEFLSLGYIVPLWCDIEVEVTEEGYCSWRTPNAEFQCMVHPDSHYRDHLENDFAINLKLVSPWYVKTPSEVSMIQLPLIYHNYKDFTSMPGIVRTDVMHDTHIQVLIKKHGRTLLARGTPLAMFVPIRRETFNTIIRSETKEDANSRKQSDLVASTKFIGGYREIIKKQEPVVK